MTSKTSPDSGPDARWRLYLSKKPEPLPGAPTSSRTRRERSVPVQDVAPTPPSVGTATRRRRSSTPKVESRSTNQQYLRKLWKGRGRGLTWMALGTFGLWLLVTLVLGSNGLIRLWELQAEEGELGSKLLDLQHQSVLVDRELREDRPMAIERSAREKFQMQRPGEIVFYFPSTETSEMPGEGESAAEDDPVSDGSAGDLR